MKLLHLSDLHLGKRVNEFSMLEDQAYILQQILKITEEERPDAVLIAGDIYDKSVPPAEAVQLFDDFLYQLSKGGWQVFLISGNLPRLSWLQIFYYSFAESVLVLGLGYLTSAINVFFKDMSQIVSIALQFGMWLVPIMYWEGIFTTDHPWMEQLFKLNPFYYIVAGYRDSMLTGALFFERPLNTLYFWIVSFLLFYLGLRIFMKLRPHFSDVL